MVVAQWQTHTSSRPSSTSFLRRYEHRPLLDNDMSENDKKPLLSWFDKFEKILAKSGTNYQKSKIDPTDMLELYYDGKSPEDAAKSLGEELQLEWKKTDGDSRRVSGGDKRRTENKTTQPNTEVDEAESVPLVRTGQGDFKKDTHPKRKDGKVERMYQAKDTICAA